MAPLATGAGVWNNLAHAFSQYTQMRIKPAIPALGAAFLFGASTPLAKLLGTSMAPQMLAGILYLGSGAGLAVLLALRIFLRRHRGADTGSMRIPQKDLPWLASAIVAGGVIAPVLLMAGLASTAAAAAALLLNLEAVLTAAMAWLVFRENTTRRIMFGMFLIVSGGVLLAFKPGSDRLSLGTLLIAAACLFWAIDNNLTRKVSANDATLISCLKGLFAGVTNTGLALLSHASIPPLGTLLTTLVVGFVGYGVSLALFVIALRGIGAARTSAYFSIAPLFGVLVSLAIWPSLPGWTFWAAAFLMAIGVWLDIREQHEHEHGHEALSHTHWHVHDEHHQHQHDFPWDGTKPHTHFHTHAPLLHRHPHFPDLHHRHKH